MKKQSNKKIRELEAWLKANPNHPDQSIVIKDLRQLKDKLIKQAQ